MQTILKKGIYYLRIIADETQITKKINPRKLNFKEYEIFINRLLDGFCLFCRTCRSVDKKITSETQDAAKKIELLQSNANQSVIHFFIWWIYGKES